MSRILSGIFVFILLVGAVQGFAGVKPGIDGTAIITQTVVNENGGFPFKITEPGNYKLGSNLVVPANTSGIQILANDVTLDLNGFAVTGGVVCDVQGITCTGIPTSGETIGIEAIIGFANGQRSNIFGVTIKNGHVRGFTFGISTFGGLVEEITAQGNLRAGISAFEAVVRRNDASRNHGAGVECNQCTVRDNMAAFNQGNQFTLVFGGVFAGNTAVTSSATGLGVDIANVVVSDNNNSCNAFRC